MNPALDTVDVVVIGGGPAGLAAALTMARSMVSVRVLDANRPRHSATLVSHGFLTRDGIAPSELRALGRAEVDAYPTASVVFAAVDSVTEQDDGTFRVRATGVRGEADQDVVAERIIVAAGLQEQLPRVPSLRAFYGTALHSCFSCDAYEKRGQDLAVIGSAAGIGEVARLVDSVASSVTVFTNGGPLSDPDHAAIEAAGIPLITEAIEAIEHEQSAMTGLRVAGDVVTVSGGFVMPTFTAHGGGLAELGLERGALGEFVSDADGRTSNDRIYAAGESAWGRPAQLIVAAGHGTQVGVAVVRDRVLGGSPSR